MRIFKTRAFAKFASKQKIEDTQLVEAIKRAEFGLIDANLGGNIIKQRIARQGQGKSGGYRSLIFYKINDNHFFVVGFAKNEQENISATDLASLKLLAEQYANYQDEHIALLLQTGALIEVTQNEI
ncbi:type II toxin-antitoxin system RelE/ParE family toxin [Ursidibacter arcticus]|uniref:type II toxin-antitoxin system RelE/ParE family toxin n=1 Tax=Ursidibacter arcticus TaxID=1524965 RepID=UPI0012F8A594|nr:type II toxin-antitoxin system RelE/ParE family toxin [Ursidibacter arcticus]KAE9534600.1 addiction module toxin RelE [Ursidibacter arcticus]